MQKFPSDYVSEADWIDDDKLADLHSAFSFAAENLLKFVQFLSLVVDSTSLFVLPRCSVRKIESHVALLNIATWRTLTTPFFTQALRAPA